MDTSIRRKIYLINFQISSYGLSKTSEYLIIAKDDHFGCFQELIYVQGIGEYPIP